MNKSRGADELFLDLAHITRLRRGALCSLVELETGKLFPECNRYIKYLVSELRKTEKLLREYGIIEVLDEPWYSLLRKILPNNYTGKEVISTATRLDGFADSLEKILEGKQLEYNEVHSLREFLLKLTDTALDEELAVLKEWKRF